MAVAVCKYCGKQFETKSTGTYCQECKTTGVSVCCCVCGESLTVSPVVYVRESESNPDKAWMHKKCAAEFRRTQMWTEEKRQKASQKRIARWQNDADYRNRIVQSRDLLRTPEYRANMAQLADARWSDEEERVRMSETMTNFYATDRGKVTREQIATTLVVYNENEEVRMRNSERIEAFFESAAGKAQAERHSQQRKVFFETTEGKEEKVRMAERQSAFAVSDIGKVVTEQARQKRLVFMQSDEGIEFRRRQSDRMREFFQTDAGKKILEKGAASRKSTQIAEAENVLTVVAMRTYWVGVDDAELLEKHKQFLLRTMDIAFWEEIAEYIYSNFGKCSRRDLSYATGIGYGTVVFDLQRVGVPSVVKEYRKELEGEVLSFIVQHYDGDIEVCTRPDFLLNRNGNKMELDIYIPEFKLAVEVNGSYWHSSAHKDKHYHYNKSKLCRDNGIRLIHVWEHEWNNMRQRPILEAMLLSALGKSTRVFARSLSVEVRSSKEMREFFEVNNIQGFRGGKFAVCLADTTTKEVFMAYLIGKGNHMSRGYQFEVVRGASKLGYTIVGGASKLLSYIMKMPEVEQLVYYIDYNYFDGRSLKGDSKWTLKSEQVSFKNFWKKTGEVKNREPGKHVEIMEKYKTGEILQLWNAGVATYVYQAPKAPNAE